jgi:hypothetical protein
MTGPLTKTSSPTDNTRNIATLTQASRSNKEPKNPRRKETMSRAEVKGGAKNGETSQLEEEEAHMKKSGVQNSQMKRTTSQEEETCKKMKYTKNPPFITLIEDSAELVANKV